MYLATHAALVTYFYIICASFSKVWVTSRRYVRVLSRAWDSNKNIKRGCIGWRHYDTQWLLDFYSEKNRFIEVHSVHRSYHGAIK